jgi:hypothetical protein
MGDQLQQIVSCPDQGAVVAHPPTLAYRTYQERLSPSVRSRVASHLSQKRSFVRCHLGQIPKSWLTATMLWTRGGSINAG